MKQNTTSHLADDQLLGCLMLYACAYISTLSQPVGSNLRHCLGIFSCFCSQPLLTFSGSCPVYATPDIAINNICVSLNKMEADDHQSKAPVHASVVRCVTHWVIAISKQTGKNCKLQASGKEVKPNANEQQGLHNGCVDF